MASVGGKAVALCKEQKDLAVLYGLMPLSKSERVRANQRWLREALHPTLGIAVAARASSANTFTLGSSGGGGGPAERVARSDLRP